MAGNVDSAVRDAARCAFNNFLLAATQGLRPDGGERTLTVRIVVDQDAKQVNHTTTLMTEHGAGYVRELLCAKARED